MVILSHGFGGNYANGADYAERLAKMGYMAYAFDFCGGSTGSRSDGTTTDMSILTEKADLNAIIDYFRTRSDVDASRISLAGASQGGMVSALTAAERPDDIASLMLFYSALSIVDDAHRRWASYESITSVVICLKISTFVVSTTTQQELPPACSGCDLPENIYLCGINNNELSSNPYK